MNFACSTPAHSRRNIWASRRISPLLGVFQWVLDANGDVIYHNDELIVTDSHTFTIRSHIE